jgi:transcriptional regulator with XRE-family HTH domain
MTDELQDVLATVGTRLRALRKKRHVTLGQLAQETGISVSTLSRLESGGRRPTLELLLPLARAHCVPLDELVGAPSTGDPRLYPRHIHRNGLTRILLTMNASEHNAFKQIFPPDPVALRRREQYIHEGYEWVYVLAGRLRLALADQDHLLGPGEAVEFDTRVAHGYANAGDLPLELLVIFRNREVPIPMRVRTTSRAAASVPPSSTTEVPPGDPCQAHGSGTEAGMSQPE